MKPADNWTCWHVKRYQTAIEETLPKRANIFSPALVVRLHSRYSGYTTGFYDVVPNNNWKIFSPGLFFVCRFILFSFCIFVFLYFRFLVILMSIDNQRRSDTVPAVCANMNRNHFVQKAYTERTDKSRSYSTFWARKAGPKKATLVVLPLGISSARVQKSPRLS